MSLTSGSTKVGNHVARKQNRVIRGKGPGRERNVLVSRESKQSLGKPWQGRAADKQDRIMFQVSLGQTSLHVQCGWG